MSIEPVASASIVTRLLKVMEDVGAVSKRDHNEHQKFLFRGIDAVVNAVAPALRANGVIVYPTVVESSYEQIEIGTKRTLSGHARVKVCYVFYAEDGTSLPVTVVAEAMDSGDKATAKAMSVAFRTALLQALCLPTDEPDPDAQSYDRSPKREVAPANQIADLHAAIESLSGSEREALLSAWRERRIPPLAGLPADLVGEVSALIESVQGVEETQASPE